ncbi:MAG: 4-hydroxy-tetrahydrodipicolinate reductase [Solirubrobacterales bacterium]|nr:4-hydroxy-tetrahydrodipicolinate reductase [Solirubrobacterales bacterium]
MIRVAVSGAAGKMGQAVVAAVEGADDMELTGQADPALGVSLEDVLDNADVVVDFTRPDTALENARTIIASDTHCVIGTTGADFSQLEGAGSGKLFFAPNFAIGAVMLMELSKTAAKYMPECEIIELHHPAKLDSPSGTAIRTKNLIEEAGGNVHEPIHSIRLPGVIASQEVVFGETGQTLSIRHETYTRESFMPGVLLAVRAVGDLTDPITVGLENLF